MSNNDSSDRKFTFDRKITLITPYLNSQWLNPNHRGLRDDAYYGLIIGSSEIWSDKGAPKFRTLTKYHTEKWRIRRILKNTTQIGTEALLCVEQRRLFASYIRLFLFKVSISKIIRKLYATPLSFFVSSAPPWHHV